MTDKEQIEALNLQVKFLAEQVRQLSLDNAGLKAIMQIKDNKYKSIDVPNQDIAKEPNKKKAGK